MGPGAGIGEEQAGGFEHGVDPDLAPAQIGGIALTGDANRLAIHY